MIKEIRYTQHQLNNLDRNPRSEFLKRAGNPVSARIGMFLMDDLKKRLGSWKNIVCYSDPETLETVFRADVEDTHG